MRKPHYTKSELKNSPIQETWNGLNIRYSLDNIGVIAQCPTCKKWFGLAEGFYRREYDNFTHPDIVLWDNNRCEHSRYILATHSIAWHR